MTTESTVQSRLPRDRSEPTRARSLLYEDRIIFGAGLLADQHRLVHLRRVCPEICLVLEDGPIKNQQGAQPKSILFRRRRHRIYLDTACSTLNLARLVSAAPNVEALAEADFIVLSTLEF